MRGGETENLAYLLSRGVRVALLYGLSRWFSEYVLVFDWPNQQVTETISAIIWAERRSA